MKYSRAFSRYKDVWCKWRVEVKMRKGGGAVYVMTAVGTAPKRGGLHTLGKNRCGARAIWRSWVVEMRELRSELMVELEKTNVEKMYSAVAQSRANCIYASVLSIR